MKFDDRLWYHIWERNLSAAERHAIAMSVWRRRRPADRFEAMVAFELARRWRRHGLSLAFVYGLWTLFWGSIAVRDFRLDAAFESLVTPVCALIGVAAILACFTVRRRLRGYLLLHAVEL